MRSSMPHCQNRAFGRRYEVHLIFSNPLYALTDLRDRRNNPRSPGPARLTAIAAGAEMLARPAAA